MSRLIRRAVQPPTSNQAGKDIDSDDWCTPLQPTKEVLLVPSSRCEPQKPLSFTPEEETVMKNLKAHLIALHRDLAESDPEYVFWERKWIDDPSTARRYAMAVKWDEAHAKRRAADTLYWRREYKPDLIRPDEVKREGETGKHILSGFDNASRPILYLRPGRENTEPNPQQIRFLVFDLERAIDYTKASHHTQPNFATQRKVLSILQNHYPERLGHAIVVNVPWFLSTFFTAISPFLDSNTRTKISMLRSPHLVQESIPSEMLDAEFGGSWKFEFDFEKYWHDILDFCGINPDGTRSHPSKARAGNVNIKEGE